MRSFAGRFEHIAAAALAAVVLLAGTRVEAETAESRRGIDAVRLQIDNDLFAGGESDRDYTGGVAITLSGEELRDAWLSLDPLLGRIDKAAWSPSAAHTYYAQQLGAMVFTPNDILSTEVQPDDRPYASLLFVANGRMYVGADERSAWSSSLTLGVLGLSVVADLHDAVHEIIPSDAPRGYRNQISAGGEPTARYTLARHSLLVANANGNVDVKATLQGSVGFLTETSAAVSMRIGRFDTPWWGLAPELTDYIAGPVPAQAHSAQDELYFFAGARVKARAYNAFLQGQFRDSALRYSWSDVEPLIAEAWVGLVTQILDHTQLSYTLHYQTAEVRRGQAARDAFWGALQLSHAF